MELFNSVTLIFLNKSLFDIIIAIIIVVIDMFSNIFYNLNQRKLNFEVYDQNIIS